MINNHQKEFIKILNKVSYARNNYEKFRDFCFLSAYTLALPFYEDKISQQLKETFEKYSKEEIVLFNQAFDILVDALETEHQDFLGKIFGELELGNAKVGQFFTPYEVSLMIARMQLGDVKQMIAENGFITVGEPTCGSGGMVIAVRQVLLELGCNPSTDVYVEMTDIAELPFLMSYIQISLYGIAAKVIHGDSLWPDQKTYQTMFTPVFFLNDWPGRFMLNNIKQLIATPEEKEIKVIPQKTEPIIINKKGQYALNF